jgi:hypothetical protein
LNQICKSYGRNGKQKKKRRKEKYEMDLGGNESAQKVKQPAAQEANNRSGTLSLSHPG